MMQLNLMIEQFDQKGEKTGWTYLALVADVAHELKPDCKVGFRVKGKIDAVEFSGIALCPMSEGDFILPLKKEIQQKIGKRKGAIVSLTIEEDKDFKYEIPDDLENWLHDVEGTINQFYSMAKSHQNYFIRWINEAKTEVTRVKRLTQTVDAMAKKMDYGEMIRYHKVNK
ncbi:YdeI/OmpD-associated family protein [Pedobacter alpinus]|uniref:YdeI/OmpD-associated family protein n=1 Tax=Pedobacter alpinus TaxID=1590643 RepID=A0ABW5TSX0_9SPHI